MSPFANVLPAISVLPLIKFAPFKLNTVFAPFLLYSDTPPLTLNSELEIEPSDATSPSKRVLPLIKFLPSEELNIVSNLSLLYLDNEPLTLNISLTFTLPSDDTLPNM